MALYEEINLTSGVDDALVSLAQNVPVFPIMLLVFIFGLVLLGGASNQKRRTGTADIPFWSVLASLSTFIIALLMTMGEGMIDLLTLGVVTGITIMCGLWFFLSKTRGEL